MTTTPPNSFFELSSILTGFTVQTLQFAHQSADFYGEFEKIWTARETEGLLAQYDKLAVAGNTSQQIGQAILDPSSPTQAMARALMVFWYTGRIENPPGSANWVIPSPTIYAEGLAWRAVQAHATGVSNQKFGYWASKPADLSNYL